MPNTTEAERKLFLLRDALGEQSQEWLAAKGRFLHLASSRSLLRFLREREDSRSYNKENMVEKKNKFASRNNEDLPCSKDVSPLDEKIIQMKESLHQEVFEIQKEMSRREYLLEKKEFNRNENAQPKKNSNEKSKALAEIEQTEILLSNAMEKKRKIGKKMKEMETTKANALENLNGVLAKYRRKDNSQAQSPSVNNFDNAHASRSITFKETDEAIESSQSRKMSAMALMTGLEALLQIKLLGVEITKDKGINLSIIINSEHQFVFELDEKKKLIDIQAIGHKTGIVDPLQLLCACASLSPPHDLRHAVLTIVATVRRECVLHEHLKVSDVRKSCLIQRDSKDSCLIGISFSNGVTAQLSIHECYPNVPNGVHILSINGSGEWTTEELKSIKSAVNSRCTRELPDMIQKIISSFEITSQ